MIITEILNLTLDYFAVIKYVFYCKLFNSVLSDLRRLVSRPWCFACCTSTCPLHFYHCFLVSLHTIPLFRILKWLWLPLPPGSFQWKHSNALQSLCFLLIKYIVLHEGGKYLLFFFLSYRSFCVFLCPVFIYLKAQPMSATCFSSCTDTEFTAELLKPHV